MFRLVDFFLGQIAAMTFTRSMDTSSDQRRHPHSRDASRARRPRTTTPLGDGLGEGANSVLGKVRLILEAFDVDDDGLTLSELSRRTGIPKASVHRLCHELVAWGMLERDDVDYLLGVRAFELGSRVSRLRRLCETLRPHMETLHFMTKETVHLAVLDGTEVLYLEKVNSHAQKTRPSRIAGRMPLHCTATGKVLLAHGEPELLDEVLRLGLPRLTRSTIVLPRVLQEQMVKIRETGFALEREETTPGFASVAVPVYGHSGAVVAALSVTAPSFRADFPAYVKALTDIRRRAGVAAA